MLSIGPNRMAAYPAMPTHFDLIDIQLFINIVEKANLTHGAEHSNMSPPAASIRIKNLEERLGTKLLYRTSHGVSPTPAGETFLHHSRVVVREIDNLRRALSLTPLPDERRIRVFASAAVSEFLPDVLSAYIVSHPEIDIELSEHSPAQIVRAVNEGTAHIGILEGAFESGGLEVLPYRRERLVMISSRLHPLAKARRVEFEKALEYEFVGLRQENSIQSLLRQIAFSSRQVLKIRAVVNSFEAVSRLVEAGLGVAVLPESTARRHSKTSAIQTIELTDEWSIRSFHACVRATDSLPSYARDLIDLLIADGSMANQQLE